MRSATIMSCCLILVIVLINSSDAWWLPCTSDVICGAHFNAKMKVVINAAIQALVTGALGIFNIFLPEFGKRSTTLSGNLEKSLFYFNLADQVDKKQCLPRVLCEAAHGGRGNSSNFFETAVFNMASTISKRKPKELKSIRRKKGGHLVNAILFGNEVEDITKCQALTKTCKDKHSKVMHYQLEKAFDDYFGNRTFTALEHTTIRASEESTTEAVEASTETSPSEQ